MWDRGDKAPVIAAALGCKVGAINVARARFGLKPRRIVSGRPKEPDEPAHKIERVAFTTSRLMEFCTERELIALRPATNPIKWPRVVVKELVDNSIDACEEAEIAPVIKVTITTGKSGKPTRIVVEDNGPGIPPATITDIIDYNVRVSSREAYISPTRGRQGNALKTLLPMSYVLGGKIKGETWIEARGRKHRLVFRVNQIKQEPIVRNIRSRSRVTLTRPSLTPTRSPTCSRSTLGSTRISLFGSSLTARPRFIAPRAIQIGLNTAPAMRPRRTGTQLSNSNAMQAR
jgi:hypothetical protein